MSKTDTWMPLYIGDYLADTMHLTAAEHGAYLLLIMTYWRVGPLPDDDKKLAKMARCSRQQWAEIGQTVRDFFVRGEGLLTHKRIENERAKTAKLINKRAEAGRRGASNRWATQPFDNNTPPDGNCHTVANDKPIANTVSEPMAIAMRLPYQNDGQSQSQSQRVEDTPPSLRSGSPHKRGERLSDNWEPGQDEVSFAVAQGLNPEAVAAQFRDYWHAIPGARGRKLDWAATWRNWCRNDAKRGGKIVHMTAFERRKAESDRKMAEWLNPEMPSGRLKLS